MKNNLTINLNKNCHPERNEGFIKLAFLTLILSVALMTSAYAKVAGTTMADFLKVGIDAKTAAMGGVYVSNGDDVYALSTNIAGTSDVENREMSFSHLGYVESIYFENLQYAQKLGKGVLGVDIRSMHTTDDRLSEIGNKTGVFTDRGNAFMVSYASHLTDSLSYGVGVKYIYMSLDSESGNSYGFDAGILYKMLEKARIGVSVQNIGPRMKLAEDENEIPAIVRLGGDYLVMEKLDVAGEMDIPLEGEKSYGIGAEYKVMEKFLIRTGYKHREEGNNLGGLDGFAAGFGINLGKYSLDYAFVPFGEFDNTHRVSLKLKF